MKIRNPIPFPWCFVPREDGKYSSQKAYASAAVLLGIGYQLDGNYVPLPGYVDGGRPVEEDREFPLPRLEPSGKQFLRTPRDEFQRFEGEEAFHIERLARRLEQLEGPEAETTAVQLLEFSFMHHPFKICRVAAASSYFNRLERGEDRDEIISFLINQATFQANTEYESLVVNLASATLGRIYRRFERLWLTHFARPGFAPARQINNESLLVHGTFGGAPNPQHPHWWEPGGDFHDYLTLSAHKKPAPNSRFYWSGGYSAGARTAAAQALAQWIGVGTNVYAHSHGANVAMLSCNYGNHNFDQLVLLSCPVRVPELFRQKIPFRQSIRVPPANRYQRIIDVRLKWDLVIMADGAAQRFPENYYQNGMVECQLDLWFFNHGGTHDPAVWKKENLLNDLGL